MSNLEIQFLNSCWVLQSVAAAHLALIMGWLRLVGSLKVKVSNAKEPRKRGNILQKIPIILRSLLIVAIPSWWHEAKYQLCCRTTQRVAVCHSVLQSVAECCRVLQSVAECCRVLQSVAVCCRVLQNVAVCCSALQCVAMRCSPISHVFQTCHRFDFALDSTATRCTTLQHTAPHCNTLQHTATLCNTLQHTATHCKRCCTICNLEAFVTLMCVWYVGTLGVHVVCRDSNVCVVCRDSRRACGMSWL